MSARVVQERSYHSLLHGSYGGWLLHFTDLVDEGVRPTQQPLSLVLVDTRGIYTTLGGDYPACKKHMVSNGKQVSVIPYRRDKQWVKELPSKDWRCVVVLNEQVRAQA
jgi:hypothetical protein